MSVIENFAVLSFEEQKKFAEALIKTINSESIFTSDTDFTLYDLEADDLTGGLRILLDHDKPIEVHREATWACASEEEVRSDPGYDAYYTNNLFEDTKKAFKTLSATIDGYKVLLELDDVDEEETVEVEVENYSFEDAGIGDYEFWGQTGHDSQPYVEVTGAIVKACSCAPALFVEPVDVQVEEEPDEE